MQFPMLSRPNTEESRLHRRRPNELHWRRDPPAWPGKVESAYRRLYPHLVDAFCCMQCGAVPCPYDHDKENETRMKDFAFIKQMVEDKKSLELKVGQVSILMEITKPPNHMQF